MRARGSVVIGLLLVLCAGSAWSGQSGECPSIGLKEVSFGDATTGRNWYTVRTDDNKEGYSAPQWQDNSSPLDGDADDGVEFAEGADREFPVCYTWGTKASASCLIYADPGWGPLVRGNVYIRGSGDLDFPSREATVEGNALAYPATDAEVAFPAAVQRIPELTIRWEASTDGQATWHEAGTSANEVFVYRPRVGANGVPGSRPYFRTVLYLATNGGGTDADDCVARTWAQFEPLRVCRWDRTARAYSDPMRYYGPVPWPPNGDYVWLLAMANGNCYSWAQLLQQCLLANNVPDVSIAMAAEPNPEQTPWAGFVVKNIGFGPPTYDDPPWGRWVYAPWDLDWTLKGIAGQSMDTPGAKAFNYHRMVYVGGTSTYYDPSYGLTIADDPAAQAAYTASAVDAWIKMCASYPGPDFRWHFSQLRTTDPPLKFTHPGGGPRW